MRNKVSLVVLTGSGHNRQFCTTRSTLRCLAGAAFLLFGVFVFLVYDYTRLRQAAADLRLRETDMAVRLSGQQQEVELQRRQIGDFAQDINHLKERLLGLNAFERKIRLMADLEKRPDAGNLFGVGGPVPRTLDPKAVIGEERNSLVREMHSQVEQLKVAAVNQGNGFQALVGYMEKQQFALASTPTIRPIDPDAEHLVSSRFEYRHSPFTGLKEFHRAIDISAREGTPIYATASGVVTFSGVKGLLGRTIIIDHGHGLTTTYGHCSRLLKQAGERVARWDTVALVGNTGSSTGPHVHYEVALHGVPVNPEKYFLN